MSVSSQQFESYVPVYDVIPDKWEEARPFIVEQFKKVSNAINSREIGWFLDEEVLSGKAFVPGVNAQGNASPDQFRQVLRKVVNCGTLPNAGTSSTPHGILFDINFTLVQLYGAATDPTAKIGIPLPFVSTGAQPIQLNINQNTVDITTTANFSTYTRVWVTIEYLQEL